MLRTLRVLLSIGVLAVAALSAQPASAGGAPSTATPWNPSAPEESRREGRVALVIGNARYGQGWRTLKSGNAEAMADLLGSLGFVVVTLLNGNREAMERAIADFRTRLRDSSDTGLFYFSGHGVSIDGGDVLLPVDLPERIDEVGLRHASVGMGALLGGLSGRKGATLVFLDTSRTNPFVKGSSPLNRTRPEVGRGMVVGYAAGPGLTASDGNPEAPYSPFTAALLKAFAKPGAEIAALFPDIVGDVAAATQGAQVPQFVYSLTKPFHFVPPAGTGR